MDKPNYSNQLYTSFVTAKARAGTKILNIDATKALVSALWTIMEKFPTLKSKQLELEMAGLSEHSWRCGIFRPRVNTG